MSKKETIPKQFTNNDAPVRVCPTECPYSYTSRVKDFDGFNVRLCSGKENENLNCSLPKIDDKPEINHKN